MTSQTSNNVKYRWTSDPKTGGLITHNVVSNYGNNYKYEHMKRKHERDMDWKKGKLINQRLGKPVYIETREAKDEDIHILRLASNSRVVDVYRRKKSEQVLNTNPWLRDEDHDTVAKYNDLSLITSKIHETRITHGMTIPKNEFEKYNNQIDKNIEKQKQQRDSFLVQQRQLDEMNKKFNDLTKLIKSKEYKATAGAQNNTQINNLLKHELNNNHNKNLNNNNHNNKLNNGYNNQIDNNIFQNPYKTGNNNYNNSNRAPQLRYDLNDDQNSEFGNLTPIRNPNGTKYFGGGWKNVSGQYSNIFDDEEPQYPYTNQTNRIRSRLSLEAQEKRHSFFNDSETRFLGKVRTSQVTSSEPRLSELDLDLSRKTIDKAWDKGPSQQQPQQPYNNNNYRSLVNLQNQQQTTQPRRNNNGNLSQQRESDDKYQHNNINNNNKPRSNGYNSVFNMASNMARRKRSNYMFSGDNIYGNLYNNRSNININNNNGSQFNFNNNNRNKLNNDNRNNIENNRKNNNINKNILNQARNNTNNINSNNMNSNNINIQHMENRGNHQNLNNMNLNLNLPKMNLKSNNLDLSNTTIIMNDKPVGKSDIDLNNLNNLRIKQNAGGQKGNQNRRPQENQNGGNNNPINNNNNGNNNNNNNQNRNQQQQQQGGGMAPGGNDPHDSDSDNNDDDEKQNRDDNGNNRNNNHRNGNNRNNDNNNGNNNINNNNNNNNNGHNDALNKLIQILGTQAKFQNDWLQLMAKNTQQHNLEHEERLMTTQLATQHYIQQNNAIKNIRVFKIGMNAVKWCEEVDYKAQYANKYLAPNLIFNEIMDKKLDENIVKLIKTRYDIVDLEGLICFLIYQYGRRHTAVIAEKFLDSMYYIQQLDGENIREYLHRGNELYRDYVVKMRRATLWNFVQEINDSVNRVRNNPLNICRFIKRFVKQIHVNEKNDTIRYRNRKVKEMIEAKYPVFIEQGYQDWNKFDEVVRHVIEATQQHENKPDEIRRDRKWDQYCKICQTNGHDLLWCRKRNSSYDISSRQKAYKKYISRGGQQLDPTKKGKYGGGKSKYQKSYKKDYYGKRDKNKNQSKRDFRKSKSGRRSWEKIRSDRKKRSRDEARVNEEEVQQTEQEAGYYDFEDDECNIYDNGGRRYQRKSPKKSNSSDDSNKQKINEDIRKTKDILDHNDYTPFSYLNNHQQQVKCDRCGEYGHPSHVCGHYGDEDYDRDYFKEFQVDPGPPRRS